MERIRLNGDKERATTKSAKHLHLRGGGQAASKPEPAGAASGSRPVGGMNTFPDSILVCLRPRSQAAPQRGMRSELADGEGAELSGLIAKKERAAAELSEMHAMREAATAELAELNAKKERMVTELTELEVRCTVCRCRQHGSAPRCAQLPRTRPRPAMVHGPPKDSAELTSLPLAECRRSSPNRRGRWKQRRRV